MIERLGIEEWLAFDAAHPAPTFFARPAWAISLAQVYPGMRPVLLRIAIKNDAPVLLPLMQMHGGLLRWREFRGFPLGGYTCFLRENGTLAPPAACAAALTQLTAISDTATIVPWPLGPAPAVPAHATHETSVIDLSSGLESALSNVDGAFRRMAGQAARRGVICEPCSDPDAVDRYYALLESSAKRWGLEAPTIPKHLITALTENGGPDVQVWFARAEGCDIGGGVVFYGSREFFFWSAAMLSEYGRLRPSNALNFALLRAAAERGMHWYNLGSSEGLPGVARFKKDLGTTDITYYEYQIARSRFKLYTNVRRTIAPRVTA